MSTILLSESYFKCTCIMQRICIYLFIDCTFSINNSRTDMRDISKDTNKKKER